MSTYLEEAAAQLRKTAGKDGDYVPPETRLRIAEGFTRLAAIEKGLVPPDWQQAEGEDRERV